MSTTTTADPAEFWRVTPPNDGDPVLANLMTEPPAAHPPAGEVTFTFIFRRLPGEERIAYRDRHARLLAYEDIAGRFAPDGGGTDWGNTPWFREQHRQSGLSVVAAIRPPDAKQAADIRGLWGLVNSVEEATNASRTRWSATLSMVHLAALEEFDTATDVRAALEADGI